MSFRTRRFRATRHLDSRNYYFSSMSFRTMAHIIQVLTHWVATTISAVCPFGLLWIVLIDELRCVATTISAVCPFGHYTSSVINGELVATTISAVCPFGQSAWSTQLRQWSRNYYFSSMSFRTLTIFRTFRSYKSQLLFQQYVLSDYSTVRKNYS